MPEGVRELFPLKPTALPGDGSNVDSNSRQPPFHSWFPDAFRCIVVQAPLRAVIAPLTCEFSRTYVDSVHLVTKRIGLAASPHTAIT